jgi:hypothetical protein
MLFGVLRQAQVLSALAFVGGIVAYVLLYKRYKQGESAAVAGGGSANVGDGGNVNAGDGEKKIADGNANDGEEIAGDNVDGREGSVDVGSKDGVANVGDKDGDGGNPSGGAL